MTRYYINVNDFSDIKTSDELIDQLDLKNWKPIAPLLVKRFKGDKATISRMMALADENLRKLRALLS